MGEIEEFLRSTVQQEMKKRGLTHAELAEQMEMARPQVTRMLTGKTRLIPHGWLRLLDALGLEITVKPKGSPRKEEE